MSYLLIAVMLRGIMVDTPRFARAATETPAAGAVAPLPPRHDASVSAPTPTVSRETPTPLPSPPPMPHAVQPRVADIMPQPTPHQPGTPIAGNVGAQANAHLPAQVIQGTVAAQPPRHDLPNPHFARGVNLPAPSFNAPEFVPGVRGTNYEYPSTDDLDYFKAKGFTLFRVPFSWERMQPTLNGALDATQLGYMDTLVAAAHTRNLHLILDQHNDDRYRIQRTSPPTCDEACVLSQEILVGTADVPYSAFADFWRRFAAHYAAETAIAGYDLTNEPHDTGGTWPNAAQAATTAIRQVDHFHTIIVEGDNYAAASTWTTYNENLFITDPDNNIVYSAHIYFDADGSGQYNHSYDAEGATPSTGVMRAQPFVDWLNRHHVRGYIGEYGIPGDDTRWFTVLDNLLTYLDVNALDGTYWAAGPFLDGYRLSVNPVGGVDAPQMATLVRHLGR